MAVDTTTAPELTAEDVQHMLVRPLEDASVFLAAGPKIIDSAGPVRIPKMGGPIVPSFVGEGELIPEVNPDFDELALLPSTMKSIKTITRFSNEMARQSIVALDTTLKDRLVRDVANSMDAQFLSDTGDGITKPRGLFAYKDVQTMDVAGPLALDDLHDAVGMAMGANVDTTRTRWVMRSGDFVALRKLKDTAGHYLMQPDPTKAGAYSLLGIPVTITNRIPKGKAALLDVSQIVVARDVAMSVKLLDERYAEYDQQAIRVVSRLDAAPLNPEAVLTITGIGGESA